VNERNEPLIEELRRLRLVLLYRIAILRARPSTKPLATALIQLSGSIERELEREAELSVEEVRTEATIDAIAERVDELRLDEGLLQAQLGKLAEKSGCLMAERVRIEARLSAERSAVKKTQQLLDIKLRAAAVARGDTVGRLQNGVSRR
jgi:hypothetical protein